MDLKDVDILTLCPAFMRKDKTNRILAEGSNNIFRQWANDLERLSVVNHFDNLKEDELDQLAKDMNIFWYNTNANMSIKRSLIKNAKLVFKRLGTVWAVESVMNDYLPNSELKEWFEYDGEPGYFKFVTNNIDILKTDITTFLHILEKIKRKSQWLEGIILELRAKGTMHPGIGFIEESTDIFTFIIPNKEE